MPERKRAYYADQLVTILDGKIGGRGKTKIRNGFGFEEEVNARDLKPVPKEEPESKFTFNDPTD